MSQLLKINYLDMKFIIYSLFLYNPGYDLFNNYFCDLFINDSQMSEVYS